MSDPTPAEPLRYRISLSTGVPALVKAALTANTAGLRDTILGLIGATVDPFIKPDAAGVWPVVERSTTNPGTRMWLRHLPDGALAPMPTAAVGYLTGDLVFPGETEAP